MLDNRMTRTVSGSTEHLSGAGAPPPFVVPIFLASAVTGAAVPLLHAFLNALRPASGQPAGSPSPPASPVGSSMREGAAMAAMGQPAAAACERVEPGHGLVREGPMRAGHASEEPAHFQVSAGCSAQLKAGLAEHLLCRNPEPALLLQRACRL